MFSRSNKKTAFRGGFVYVWDETGNLTRFDKWNTSTNSVDTVRYLYNSANQVVCIDKNNNGRCGGNEFVWQYDK